MKRLILILFILLIPLSAFALDQMKDKDLDQVTAGFGVSAAQDAAPLAAPPAVASSIAGDITPVTPPAELVGQAIVDGGYANDRQDDTTRMITYTSNMNDLRVAATLGFF